MCNLSQGVLALGIEKGIEKEKRNTIENLLKKNMSDEFIMEVAQVSRERLNEIKDEILCMVQKEECFAKETQKDIDN